MKTLVIGLGNPILGDDGVGWKVAEEVRKQMSPSPIGRGVRGEGEVDVDFLSLGGISLMEHLWLRACDLIARLSDQEPGSVVVTRW
jgi:Ni,Fe-hydrogenase maturation factor